MRSTALVSAAFLSLAFAAPAGAADVKEIHKSLPLDPDGRVSLHTFKGGIDVTTWEKPEVEVAARVEPDESGRDQARKVRETEVRIEGTGHTIRIESDYSAVHRSGLFGIFGDMTLPFVRYRIRMPKGARLEVHDYKSQSRLEGLAGPLDFDTYKGEVEIAGMAGEVKLQTYKGEVRARFARLLSSRFETYKGEVEITLPREAAFELDADLGRRGDLRTDFESVTKASGRYGGGERRRFSVNGGGPQLRLETYKGSFRIRAAAPAGSRP